MRQPTDKEINAAMAWLRLRIDAELSIQHECERLMAKASSDIARVLEKYGLQGTSLDKIHNRHAQREIEAIVDKLIEDLYYDVELLCQHANEDDSAYILAFINEAVYGMTLHSRIASWANSLATIVAQQGTKGIHANPSAIYGMKRLLRHTIARAYMEEWKRKNKDALGFYSMRGSSYDCPICDEYKDKGFQPIEDYALPLHPNCCCYAVFIHKEIFA